MQLSIPKSALVLLVGPSGSGKSTFARRHFRPTEVVSSDACRALICDDEADQSATKEAFELLGWILEARLKRGRLTVIDATNVQAWSRTQLLEKARAYARPAVAIVFDLPSAIRDAQNQSRKGRTVAGEVIEQQAVDLEKSRTELLTERFAHVYTLRSQAEVKVTEIHLEN
jgi:protein phosphatase